MISNVNEKMLKYMGKMIRALLAGACLLISSPSWAQNLIARLQPEFDVGKIRIDFLRGEDSQPVTVKISCISRCKRHINYKGEVFNYFLSVSVLGNKSDRIYTSWTGATRNGVIIYRVSSAGVKVVFDKISQLAAVFHIDEYGHETLTTSDQGPTESSSRLFQQDWYWDGEKYRKGKRLRLK